MIENKFKNFMSSSDYTTNSFVILLDTSHKHDITQKMWIATQYVIIENSNFSSSFLQISARHSRKSHFEIILKVSFL